MDSAVACLAPNSATGKSEPQFAPEPLWRYIDRVRVNFTLDQNMRVDVQNRTRRLQPIVDTHTQSAVFARNVLEKRLKSEKICSVWPAVSVPTRAPDDPGAGGTTFFQMDDDTAEQFQAICLATHVNERSGAHTFVHVNSNRPQSNEDCFGREIIADQEANLLCANSDCDRLSSCFQSAFFVPEMAQVGARHDWRVPDTELKAILHRRASSCESPVSYLRSHSAFASGAYIEIYQQNTSIPDGWEEKDCAEDAYNNPCRS